MGGVLTTLFRYVWLCFSDYSERSEYSKVFVIVVVSDFVFFGELRCLMAYVVGCHGC